MSGDPPEVEDGEINVEETEFGRQTYAKRSAALPLILGLLAAGAVAVVGGMLLGDYVSIPGGGDEGGSAAQMPTVARPAEPDPADTLPPEPPPQVLPRIAVSTSPAPDSSRTAISPEGWVRQQDLPRQMFGNEEVRGVIAAYLTVNPEGRATACAIGGSTQVEPQRMLNASGTSICRALQANARFEPLAQPEPLTDPGPDAATGDLADKPDDPVGPVQDIASPPSADAQVFVRVAFRTLGESLQPGEGE